MIYLGSKKRIAKEILPIILKDRAEGQFYVEPFVGGANLIDKVTGNRIGADLNYFLIEALKLIRDNPESLPEKVTESDYKIAKSEDYDILYSDGMRGVIGFTCSFGSKWLGAYARNKRGQDYCKNGKNNALKQSPFLRGVDFRHSSYLDLEIPAKSIIYCDPPYEGTTGYMTGKFDHEVFWQWCRDKSNEGHNVFVSEYNAPKDFICVWSKEILCHVNKNSTKKKKPTEKLYTYI